MKILEALYGRHAVRSYILRPIEDDVVYELRSEITQCNQESGLHIQLITNEPEAFSGFRAHWGKFSGVQNYFALVGPQGPDLQERIGYYGERLVLKAQQLGLNTCWVAMTYQRDKCRCSMREGDKLVCVIAVGYGTTPGAQHKSRSVDSVCQTDRPIPDWFRSGVEAALLAPTAMNQQRFLLTLDADTVHAKSTGGFFSKVDLGIVKYQFELGAGNACFRWI